MTCRSKGRPSSSSAISTFQQYDANGCSCSVSVIGPAPVRRMTDPVGNPVSLRHDPDLRHLRPHRGHSRHADAAAAPGSARPRRSSPTRPGSTSFHLAEHHGSEPLHGADAGDLHRRRVADHEDDPLRADGEAAAAAPSASGSSRTCASPTSSPAAASTSASAVASRRSSTAWFGSSWTESKERFEDALGIICNAFATGEISSAGQRVSRLPDASRSRRSPSRIRSRSGIRATRSRPAVTA